MNSRISKRSVATAAFFLTLWTVGQAAWANPKNEVYVLGDSLSDTGNLHGLVLELTYGTVNFPPSPPYAERLSNGPVWAEYFADELGVPLDSRAYGGGLTGEVTYLGTPYTNYNSVAYGLPQALPGLQEEVAQLRDAYAQGLNPDALYVIWAGANDFFYALEFDFDNLPDLLFNAITNVQSAVCALNEAGAQHFAVINVPDLGLTPYGRSLGPEGSAAVSMLVGQFNQGLKQAMDAVKVQCAITLLTLDSYSYLQDIVSNPEEYGFVDTETPCIMLGPGADCSQHVFWDIVHPTTAAHEVLAGLIRRDFCGTRDRHPGLRGKRSTQPPPQWLGTCYGAR